MRLLGVRTAAGGHDLPRVFEHAGQETARRLNGAYVHGGVRQSRVHFSSRGRPAEIRFFPQEGPRPARTGVDVRLPVSSSAVLQLCHECLARALGAEFGFEDVEVGDRELDYRFMIRSRPPAFGGRLFSLEPLAPKVELVRDRLSVRVPVLLHDAARLVELARGAAALLEDVEDAIAGADIHWTSMEAGQGGCQVCLGALKEDVGPEA